MKTLEEVIAAWQEDCQIPRNDLAETSRSTPKHHAKYLEVLANAKLRLKKTEMDQKILLKNKWLYYNGKMDKDEVESRGWNYDPLDGRLVMKGDMNKYYDADPDIQKSEENVIAWKTVTETLTEIVNNLNWRHQTIGNMIRWRMFESGS